jgi:hypothetical protein
LRLTVGQPLSAELLKTIRPAELEKFYQTSGIGIGRTAAQQTHVPVRDLHVALKVFQPRSEWEQVWKKEEHIRDLVRLLKQGHTLDAILVFPVAGLWIVVDGHCRRDAHLLNDPGGTRVVPIHRVVGSFQDAFYLSSTSNSRNTLNLSALEKAEDAWRKVLYEEIRQFPRSLRDIERATGCSKSVIGRMRECLKKYPMKETDGALVREHDWISAKNRDRVSTLPNFDLLAELDEREIADIARITRKALGPKYDRKPRNLRKGFVRAYACLMEVGSLEPLATDFPLGSDF